MVGPAARTDATVTRTMTIPGRSLSLNIAPCYHPDGAAGVDNSASRTNGLRKLRQEFGIADRQLVCFRPLSWPARLRFSSANGVGTQLPFTLVEPCVRLHSCSFGGHLACWSQ
jgi:hypothetical protein